MENNNKRVDHPDHYTWLKELAGVEVIDITRHMNFNLGNVCKYVLRAGHKHEDGIDDNDKCIEDLKKAQWYLTDEIKRLEKNKKDVFDKSININTTGRLVYNNDSKLNYD